MKYNAFFLLFVLLSTIYGCSSNNSSDHNNINEVLKDTVVESEKQIGIKMTKVGGVYQIPCVVNGVKMNFIFDTGASNVCISLTEARFLAKNGYIEKEDYIGRSTSQIADGSVVENMEINLHSIEIGGVMLTDVKAVVVNSTTAPLLLGQSAIKKLGRVEIVEDSLFIVNKEKKKLSLNQDNFIQESTETPLSLEEPVDHWYDKLFAFFGYEGKIDDFLSKASSAYESGMPEKAFSYCKKAIEVHETAKAHGLLGYYYYKQYEMTNDGSVNFDDIVTNAFLSLNNYYKLNNDKEDYICPSGLVLCYDSLACYLGWAEAIKFKNYDSMLELGQELYIRNPQNVDAMTMISFAYTKQGKYDLATKWAKKILETHLNDRQGYFRLAYLAEEQGRYTEAIRYYEKCLEIDNNDNSAINNLANTYWSMSLYDNGNERYGEKWDTMRAYAVFLWQKSARLGNPYSQRILKEKGYEW